MALTLEEFYKDLFQEVLTAADANGQYLEDSFFEIYSEQLVQAGDIDTADRSSYAPETGGIRVDGYGGDPTLATGVLSLIILDFKQVERISSLTNTEMDKIFNRLNNFLIKSIDSKFRNSLEESSPAFGLADLISSRWSKISKVRFILFSNQKLSSRVDGREADEFDGKAITYSVWDIERLYRFAAGGKGREDIVINLEQEYGKGFSILPAHLDQAGYEAYLSVVPGQQLAEIYDKWGARLLEQNVRVFLQARGNINKGIKNTIENNPEMFFAYNNGITATAEEITTKDTEIGNQLIEVKNLQIVNGGQTTASIHAAYRKGTDLSKVSVQLKLSIVPLEESAEVVPKISEYANSQNKVNAADFFANHPFHIRMEDFSRRLFAPSADGSFRESKWFYERARGQYQDSRNKLSVSERKKFDLEYPKSQLFTKTDLAKYLNVWELIPDIVSKGAQKNFARFALDIGKSWGKNKNIYNEGFFKEACAKAIIFRFTEKLVTAQDWYQGGYRANIVAYSIAKLAYETHQKGLVVDFQKVWRNQKVSEGITAAMTEVSRHVHDIIINPPVGIRNVTEWAKNQACWSSVKNSHLDLPSSYLNELVETEEDKVRKGVAEKDQKILDGIAAQAFIVNAGADFWVRSLNWAVDRGVITHKEEGLLKTATFIPSKIPTEKQSPLIISTLKKLMLEGMTVDDEISRKLNF